MIQVLIKKVMAVLFVLVNVILLNPVVTYSCPGCKAALNGSVGRGFNFSILFLMAMPFLIVGAIAVGLIYAHRQTYKKSRNKKLSTVQSTK